MLRYINNFGNMHEDKKSNRSIELRFESKTSLDTYEYLKFTRGIRVEVGPFQPLLLVVGFKMHQEKNNYEEHHTIWNMLRLFKWFFLSLIWSKKGSGEKFSWRYRIVWKKRKIERNVWRLFYVSLHFKSKHKSYKAKCRFILIKI